MGIDKVIEDKPLNTTQAFVLGSTATNQTEYILDVRGVTDLIVFIENTHASEGMTVKIEWAMAVAGHKDTPVYIDALGSSPTIAADNIDHWRFGSKLFKWVDTEATPIHYTPEDPYYVDVLPCNFIKIIMYGTTAASACTVWIQGHRKRL